MAGRPRQTRLPPRVTAPLVSLGIPTVDRLPYLIEAVESALAQTWANIEVLVGDDGHSAAVRDWCLRRREHDPRLHYHRNATRLGLAGNWNAIAARASGEFVAFIGDDDRLLPAFVERLVTAFSPEIAVVFCNHHVIDARGLRLDDETARVTRQYHRAGLSDGDVPSPVVAWQLAICGSAVMTRRRDVLRLGFSEELNSPDIEFFIRLAGEGARFRFVGDSLSECRIHPATETASGLRNDVLTARLIPLSVPIEIEPLKQALIQRLAVNAVSVALQRGDWRQARAFLRSDYYPAAERTASVIQRACVTLQSPVGTTLYRALLFAKRRRDAWRRA